MVIGGSMRYVPDAVVVHEVPDHRLRRRYFLERMYVQGRSEWQLDRGVLEDSFAAGMGMAWHRVAYVMEIARREGIWRPRAAFKAVCELVRASGMLREAAGAALASRRGAPAKRVLRQEAGQQQSNLR
jgi:hypothetical protein